jgi:ATP/maltotriose-dependent transcriptional regulator MalT
LKALKYPLAPETRVQVLMSAAVGDASAGNTDRANEFLDEAFAITEKIADLRILYSLGILLYPGLLALPSGKNRFQKYIDMLSFQLEQPENQPEFSTPDGWESGIRSTLKALLHMHKSTLLGCHGKFNEAIQEAESALRISQSMGGMARVEMESGLVVPMLYTLLAKYDSAENSYKQLYQRMSELTPDFTNQFWYPVYPFRYAQLFLAQGKLDEARTHFDHLTDLRDSGNYPMVNLLYPLLEGQFAIVEKRYAEAEQILLAFLELQQKQPYARNSGNAGIHLAHLYVQWQKPQQALPYIAQALLDCEKENSYGQLFFDGSQIIIPLLKLAVERGLYPQFALKALALLDVKMEVSESSAVGIAVPGTGEMLTPREVEILALVATGKSNQEIAEKLVISLHTVKRHVAHVLDKFGVESRTQVAAVAHEMKLV